MRTPSHQLTLLDAPQVDAPRWALEGSACTACEDGRMHMLHASDPCACAEALCICLAEGYAVCDCCGEIRQVWPREMVGARPSDLS